MEWVLGRRAAPVQIKKASFLTKLVVLTLLIAASVALLRLQGQITAQNFPKTTKKSASLSPKYRATELRSPK